MKHPHVRFQPRALAGLVAGAAVTLAVLAPAAQAQAAVHKVKLMYRYRVASTCTVYPNFPKAGVVGNAGHTWTIPAGRTVIWRYNVDGAWALVSDPARATGKHFPWWGFTQRSCIGTSVKQKGLPAGRPVPNRILQGRSQAGSGWHAVTFDLPAAPIRAHHRKLKANTTLRDGDNFVTGDAFRGWHVDVTTRTRAHGWVEVYVPNARRWAYIPASDLS